jgi:hypothetical protein
MQGPIAASGFRRAMSSSWCATRNRRAGIPSERFCATICRLSQDRSRNGRLAGKGELFVQLPNRLGHPPRFQVQAEGAHILEVGRDLLAGGKVEASLPAGLDEQAAGQVGRLILGAGGSGDAS